MFAYQMLVTIFVGNKVIFFFLKGERDMGGLVGQAVCSINGEQQIRRLLP